MKLLSIAIPFYNSQDYMESCIESLLVGGEEVQMRIVDDGSSDRTAEIADDYARKYPTIVKAIHQENGGHGEAVNAGIRNATGLYFKVVDSDDRNPCVSQESHCKQEQRWEMSLRARSHKGFHSQKEVPVPPRLFQKERDLHL